MSDRPDPNPPSSPEPEEEARRAIDAALSFLSYRPRTRVEVRRKLADKGFAEKVIETALTRLDSVGLLDDLAFVEAYVRDRIAHRPMSIGRMTEELYLKGISRDATLPVIQRVFDEETVGERVLAERAAAKKSIALLEADDRDMARRRLQSYLARRGFKREVIREVVDERLPAG